jgi:hypothetical protein
VSRPAIGREVFVRALLLLAFVLACALPALATTENVDWEGTYTVLGLYGTGDPPILATLGSPPDPLHGQSLRLEDNSPSGTPQAYIAWVKGLSDGDAVQACFQRYDTSPGASPSCRIWGHWNDDPGDINGYAGSAGGNGDYGPGEGWDAACHEWVVADGHTGLVIEVRTYSSPGDVVWIDELEVTAPDHAEIVTPETEVPVDSATWSAIKALYR